MTKTLAEQVTVRTASEAMLIVGLKEVAALLLHLREAAMVARDTLLQGEKGEKPLLMLVEHPVHAVRLAACQCLWALVLAFPPQLAGLLNASLNRVRIEHAKAKSSVANKSNDAFSMLLAHSHAVTICAHLIATAVCSRSCCCVACCRLLRSLAPFHELNLVRRMHSH